MRIPQILIALILAASAVLGATVTGTAYMPDLVVARYGILSINTTPAQRIIMTNGTYDVTVPQGTYAMQVSLNIEGRLYEDEIAVTITDDGEYSYDFILFPGEVNGTQHIPEVDEELIFSEPSIESRHLNWVPALLLIAVLVGLALFLAPRQWWSGKAVAKDVEHNVAQQALAADLQSTIAFIQEQGGRTTQKELRKHIPCSEAKLSMMLTELEAKGRIQKIKKGRGNLIILKH